MKQSENNELNEKSEKKKKNNQPKKKYELSERYVLNVSIYLVRRTFEFKTA